MSVVTEMKIPFRSPTIVDDQDKYISAFLSNPLVQMEQLYSNKCIDWLKRLYPTEIYMTKSCTQALELTGQLLNIESGDEVILPSFGFVSIANAFVLRGARCRFVDIREDNMNINEMLIESAITPKTRAIITLNYAGVGCNYDTIRSIAHKYNLTVIEDNAHGILAKYKGKYLGSFGDISTISFDNLKNITCGQGGAIVFNNDSFDEQARICYEFGTNKMDLLQGKVDRYEWKGLGSNYHLSELLSAFLLAQLESSSHVIKTFKAKWDMYDELLSPLSNENIIRMPSIDPDCDHNAHLFYFFTKSTEKRKELIDYLMQKGIVTTFHFTPLHSSDFGRKNGTFCGKDIYTTILSETLLRLPLYYSLKEEEIIYVVKNIYDFYGVDFRP